MKKFCATLVCIFLIAIALDIFNGLILNKLISQSKGGEIYRMNKIMNKTNEDILIFGSSRALFHYNPDVIIDSLHMSCYNCGLRGQGIICFYGIYKSIEKRYSPKMIIYDFFPEYDLETTNNDIYISPLLAYYNEPEIKAIVNSVDPLNKVKMLSSSYKYNSKILMILNSAFLQRDNPNDNGFVRCQGYSDSTLKREPSELETGKTNIDSLKVYYLKKLITDTRGKSNLIFVISPHYASDYNKYDDYIEIFKSICKAYNIQVIDHYDDTSFHKAAFFSDPVHLNENGARVFSHVITSELKHYYRTQE